MMYRNDILMFTVMYFVMLSILRLFIRFFENLHYRFRWSIFVRKSWCPKIFQKNDFRYGCINSEM